MGLLAREGGEALDHALQGLLYEAWGGGGGGSTRGASGASHVGEKWPVKNGVKGERRGGNNLESGPALVLGWAGLVPLPTA